MTTPSFVSMYYCTDEDIATRARSDFVQLCNREYLASGTDGVFASGNRWQLTSAGSAFSTQGIGTGHVLFITKPSTVVGASGAIFAVDSAVGSAINLRRINMGLNVGDYIGPVGGATGVQFSVPTLMPQIELASYQLNKRFGINDIIAGRQPASLFDPRELRDVCVFTVLCDRYLDLAKQSDKDDVWLKKSSTYRQLLGDLLSRASVHWAANPDPTRETNRFTTKLVRG